MICTKLQQTQCKNSKGKSTFCVVNSDKAFISTELADLMYGKVEKNQVLGIDYITRTIQTREKGTNGTS